MALDRFVKMEKLNAYDFFGGLKGFGQKKAHVIANVGFLVLCAWRFPTFAWQTATLSSALSGFTSEFGMGSGGSRSLWSPSKLVRLHFLAATSAGV